MSFDERTVTRARYVEAIRVALMAQRRGESWNTADYGALGKAVKAARDAFGGDELLPDLELSYNSFTVRFAAGYAAAWRTVYQMDPPARIKIA